VKNENLTEVGTDLWGGQAQQKPPCKPSSSASILAGKCAHLQQRNRMKAKNVRKF